MNQMIGECIAIMAANGSILVSLKKRNGDWLVPEAISLGSLGPDDMVSSLSSKYRLEVGEGCI